MILTFLVNLRVHCSGVSTKFRGLPRRAVRPASSLRLDRTGIHRGESVVGEVGEKTRDVSVESRTEGDQPDSRIHGKGLTSRGAT